MKHYLQAFLFLLFISPLYSHAETRDPASLSLGFMPYLNAEHLIKKYTPLAEYLGERLGLDVDITVARDYDRHLKLTGEDQLDISFLGGSPYVLIGNQYDKKPLLARYEFNNRPEFRSVIFVRTDSRIQTLDQLTGKRVAFGSKKSTLSTQVPLYMLMQEDVMPENLESYAHLRNHENVVLGVELGDFDAGVVAEEVFNEYVKKRAIRALAYSVDLSTHVFVSRSDMPEEMQNKISQALWDLKANNQSDHVLKAIGHNLTGFVPAQDSDYDLHREILANVQPFLEQ